MMLRDPRRVEAAPLGMKDLLGRQSVPLRRRGLIEKPREEAEPYGSDLRHRLSAPI
jgi:hypothetical protein